MREVYGVEIPLQKLYGLERVVQAAEIRGPDADIESRKFPRIGYQLGAVKLPLTALKFKIIGLAHLGERIFQRPSDFFLTRMPRPQNNHGVVLGKNRVKVIRFHSVGNGVHK